MQTIIYSCITDILTSIVSLASCSTFIIFELGLWTLPYFDFIFIIAYLSSSHFSIFNNNTLNIGVIYLLQNSYLS